MFIVIFHCITANPHLAIHEILAWFTSLSGDKGYTLEEGQKVCYTFEETGLGPALINIVTNIIIEYDVAISCYNMPLS